MNNIPKGWKLVPEEPTKEQTDRALHDIGTPQPKETKQWCRNFYKAMLAATPKPPTEGDNQNER